VCGLKRRVDVRLAFASSGHRRGRAVPRAVARTRPAHHHHRRRRSWQLRRGEPTRRAAATAAELRRPSGLAPSLGSSVRRLRRQRSQDDRRCIDRARIATGRGWARRSRQRASCQRDGPGRYDGNIGKCLLDRSSRDTRPASPHALDPRQCRPTTSVQSNSNDFFE
jgi:hypothetical protein